MPAGSALLDAGLRATVTAKTASHSLGQDQQRAASELDRQAAARDANSDAAEIAANARSCFACTRRAHCLAAYVLAQQVTSLTQLDYRPVWQLVTA